MGETVEPHADLELSASDLQHLYYLMVLTRLFNEKATRLQRQGRIHSFLGCVGQEAAILGSARALRPSDWIYPTYREHPIPLLRGVELVELFHHLAGNACDRIKGRNLPPEYSFRHIHFVSISAPVGNHLAQAVGTARAIQIRRDEHVVLAYSGDGATSEGDFHVALNMAGVWKAPVVFFVQNNGWAISVPSRIQTASENFAVKAEAYGFQGCVVDGNDLTQVFKATRTAVEKAREGGGPTLIEARTYRLGPHSTSDDPRLYRDEEEVESWKQQDPIMRLEAVLAGFDWWGPDVREQTWTRAQETVQSAAEEALEAPPPPLETLFEDVYDEKPWHVREQEADKRRH